MLKAARKLTGAKDSDSSSDYEFEKPQTKETKVKEQPQPVKVEVSKKSEKKVDKKAKKTVAFNLESDLKNFKTQQKDLIPDD